MIDGRVRRGAVGAALVMGVFRPAAAEAQRFAIDAELFGGSASLAFGETGRGWGLAAGVTLPETRATLTPADGDFGELLHIAAFLRRGAGRAEADVGVRASVAGLWECTASDCWPGLFLGSYAGAFVGWRHVKFGARLQAGQFFAAGGEPDAFVVGVTPFMVRIAFGR